MVAVLDGGGGEGGKRGCRGVWGAAMISYGQPRKVGKMRERD